MCKFLSNHDNESYVNHISYICFSAKTEHQRRPGVFEACYADKRTEGSSSAGFCRGKASAYKDTSPTTLK